MVADAAFGRGLGLHTVQNLLFASILLYASLVDFDSRTIPNGCIIAAVLVRVAYIALPGALGAIDWAAEARFSLLGAVCVFVPMLLVVLLFDRLTGTESMGGGDLKLLGVAGLYFGWRQCLLLIVVACVIGIAGAVLAPRHGTGARAGSPVDEEAPDAGGEDIPLAKRQIPFGPAIASACVVTMAVGASFVQFYEGLF